MAGRSAGWPALELSAGALPERLEVERGVWGKVHGQGSDFRWLARTAGFSAGRDDLPRQLLAGPEDAPARACFWRVLAGSCYAVAAYPSRARDAGGRFGFVEKQVLGWRSAGAPAALGALLLLPRAAASTDAVWWPRREDPEWQDPDFALAIEAAESEPVPVSPDLLAQAVAQALEALVPAVTEAALTALYTDLLAGRRPALLTGLRAPLAPAALAALLLPLPRERADTLSLGGWPLSQQPELAALGDRWHLLACSRRPRGAPEAEVETDARHREQASAMARALIVQDPAPLSAPPALPVALTAGPEPRPAPLQVALWGPSAAGKTMLLAQLYLQAHGHASDWEIYPTAESLAFSERMRDLVDSANIFPQATPVGHAERILFRFRNQRTGREAELAIEDRAGRESERLDEAARRRLAAADGLLLLFDLSREEAALRAEVRRTLDQVHVASGRSTERDPRPVAVCLSKADVLVRTPADLEQARIDPDGFARRHVPPDLVRDLERLCDKVQFFAVSSVGMRVGRGLVEPVVFYDEELRARVAGGGQGLNLMAPFAWLFEEIQR